MFGWIKAAVDRVRGAGKQTLSLVANWLANALWLIDAKFLGLAKEAYGKNSIVYACLRLLSQSVPEPPLRAYQVNGEDRNILEPTHDLSRLINSPNPLMTQYEFWEMTTIHVAISGRSVWWKERSNDGRILNLWPLRPDRVGPIYSNDPDVPVIRGYSYLVPSTGSPLEIPKVDVIAFNLPDPAGESGGIVEGLGPVAVIAPEISADNEATAFVGALLANYAAPTVALKLKRDLKDKSEAEAVKSHFRAEFGGSRRGVPAVIDGDTEIQMIGFNLQQLEFPGVRNNTESRICAALGVPAVLVGVNVGLRAGSGLGGSGVVAQLRQFFTETTLMNYWRRFADQYTADIAIEYGEDIVCEFDISNVAALAPRRQEQMAPVKEAFQLGVATRNEYRAALRLPPVNDGEVYLIPANMIEVPAGGSESISPMKAIKAMDPQDAAESKLRRALETMFGPLQADIAERIRKGETVSDDELRTAFRGVLEPILVEVSSQEILRLAAESAIGFDPADLNADALAWARSYGYELVTGLTETTRSVIAEAVTAFYQNPGMTIGEVERLLEPAFGRVRAEMIAITETTRTFSQAQYALRNRLASEGIEMGMVWRTRADERVCPLCGPLNGQPEADWKDRYPTGPAAHVRCRCTVTMSVSAAKAYHNGHRELVTV